MVIGHWTHLATLVFVGPSAAVPAAVAVVMLAEGCIARSPSRTVILAGSDLPVRRPLRPRVVAVCGVLGD